MAADKELAEEDTWPSTLAKSPVPTGQAPAALDSIFCHLVAMAESHVLVSGAVLVPTTCACAASRQTSNLAAALSFCTVHFSAGVRVVLPLLAHAVVPVPNNSNAPATATLRPRKVINRLLSV